MALLGACSTPEFRSSQSVLAILRAVRDLEVPVPI